VSLTTEWLPYGSDGEFRGPAAWPARAGGPLPAVPRLVQKCSGGEHRAQHASFNDDRPSYHVGAARDAFARVLGLFASTLA